MPDKVPNRYLQALKTIYDLKAGTANLSGQAIQELRTLLGPALSHIYHALTPGGTRQLNRADVRAINALDPRGAAQARPAPKPQFGPGYRAPETTRSVTEAAGFGYPARATGRPAASPAPVPRWAPDRPVPARPVPVTVGPRGTDVPGVARGYYEGSVYKEGVPDPWRTAPIQSRLEPFSFSEVASEAVPREPLLLPRGIEPIQGRQLSLDLRHSPGAVALTDYTTSKGAVRKAGTSLGGKIYGQAPFDVSEGPLVRSQGGTWIDTSKIPPVESSLFADVQRQVGGPLPANLTADELVDMFRKSPQNAVGGVQVRDLSAPSPTFSAAVEDLPAPFNRAALDPRVLLGAGAGAFAVGGAIGVTDILARRALQDQISSQGSPALGQPTTANADLQLQDPSVTGAPDLDTGSQPIAGANPQNAIAGTANPSVQSGGTGAAMVAPRQALSFVRGGVPSSPPAPITPGSPAAPVISTAGAGGVVQLSNDADSNYNQALQNAIQGIRTDLGPTWSTPAGYKAQVEYAAAKTPEIIAAMRATGEPASVGIESDAAFQTWAERNPALAYRAFLNSQRRGVSQQMPTAQGVEVGTSFGTNMTNNAVGQSQAAAASAMYGTQGASDMADALAPRSYEIMRKLPLF